MKSKGIVLTALLAWEKPYPPTLRELSKETNYCLSYVMDTVKALEKDGLITRTPGARRTINLTEKAMTHPIYTDGDDTIDIEGNVIHFMQLSPDPTPTLPSAVDGNDNVIHFHPGVEIPTLTLVWNDDDPEDVATGIVK